MTYRNLARATALLAALTVSGCTDEPTAVRAGDVRALATEGAEALPSVNLRVMIDTITSGLIQSETEAYVVPTAAELEVWRQAVDAVAAGNVALADSLLDPYAYDVIRIVEATSSDTLTVMRERIPAGGDVARGWGTYVFNPSAQAQADIHVNHPVDDQHTEDMAAELYRDCGCRWLLMAGARRDANAGEVADMARSTSSVFHRVHTRVAAAGTRALSIHGFRIDNHTGELPADAEIVLSNGRNASTSRPRFTAADSTLRTRLNNAGFVTGLYKADAAYQDLGATQNPQGQHSNNTLGWGHWMHLEHERTLRTDSVSWKASNTVIRQWIADFPAQ